MRDIHSLYDLTGRVAVVTGGAGHIGSAIADALAECGATISIVDVDCDAAAKKATAITERWSREASTFVVDLENEQSVRAIPGAIEKRHGRLDIVVNCAALVGSSPLDGWAVPVKDQSIATWRRALEVNLTAPFVLTQSAIDALSRNGNGSVINVLSIYASVGPDERIYRGSSMGNPAAYGASKAGLMQLTRHLATTLAPNVRVNAITPGGVRRNQAADFVEQYESRTPMRRMATEEDFKGAVAFLASDASAYVTGQNIVVDGGWTAW